MSAHLSALHGCVHSADIQHALNVFIAMSLHVTRRKHRAPWRCWLQQRKVACSPPASPLRQLQGVVKKKLHIAEGRRLSQEATQWNALLWAAAAAYQGWKAWQASRTECKSQRVLTEWLNEDHDRCGRCSSGKQQLNHHGHGDAMSKCFRAADR